jgi:hypothetical protein
VLRARILLIVVSNRFRTKFRPKKKVLNGRIDNSKVWDEKGAIRPF